MKEKTKTVTFRCPVYLYEKLILEADEQRRSISSQIVKILDEYIQRKEASK